jgi:beta-glucanase (GH16 family)
MGYITVPLLNDNNLCLVLNEQFSSPSLDESVWNYDVQLGNSDFGHSDQGESGFQISTKFPENIYLSNSNLYIVPTLSSSSNFTLSDCTAQDASLCSPTGTIPPIMSARIHTKSKKSLRFGRISIRAKLPLGDWLHPRIYLLPESSAPYGPFPASGWIDILNARGNRIEYDAQGANFVRAAVGYGPLQAVQHEIFGWVSRKRGGVFAAEFHEFVLEWDQHFIRVYVDKRTQSMLEIPIGPISSSNPFSSPSSFYFPPSTKPSFWSKASFPLTIHNSSDLSSGTEIVLPNPYQNASDAAPFDQKFYLVVDLGVGGTNPGWFPDGVGGKPWLDGQGGDGAMRSFARDQARWLGTWPELGGKQERALRM